MSSSADNGVLTRMSIIMLLARRCTSRRSRDHDVMVSEGRVTGGPRLPIMGGASGAEASSVAPPACARAWREAPSDSQRSSGDGAASELNERARAGSGVRAGARSEEHTSELQSRLHLVCRLLLEKKKRIAHKVLT